MNVNSKKDIVFFRVCLILGLLTLPRFFVLYLGGDNSMLHLAYTWISRIVTICVCIMYFIKLRKPSQFLIFVILIYVVEFIMNIISQGDLRVFISQAYPLITMIMFIELMIRWNRQSFINDSAKIFSVLIISNLILMVLARDLFGANRYFLSVSNQMGCGIIIMCYVINEYCKRKNDYKLLLTISILGFISIVLSKSSNNTLSFMIILCFLLLKNVRKFVKKRNIFQFITAYAVFYVSIVFVRIQNLLSFFVEDILHKSLSLSGRTYIWDNAIPKVIKNPIFGHGFNIDSNFFRMHFTMSNGNIMDEYVSAHNTFLQVAYVSGIVPVIMLICLIVVVGNRLKAMKNAFFYVCLLSILIIMTVEAVNFDAIIVLMGLALNFHHTDIHILKTKKDIKK